MLQMHQKLGLKINIINLLKKKTSKEKYQKYSFS